MFILSPHRQNRSVASLIAIGYIAYAANNFLALVYLNYKVRTYVVYSGGAIQRAGSILQSAPCFFICIINRSM